MMKNKTASKSAASATSTSASADSITVKCPSCGHEFPLSEGVLSSVREDLANEMKGELKHRERHLDRRQKELAERDAALKEQSAALDEQVEKLTAQRVKERVDEVRAKADERAAERAATQLKEVQDELAEKADALKSARENELALRREKRHLQEAREKLELDVERRLDEERAKIKESLQAQVDEQNQLKMAEKEKLISELKVQLDAAKRKAEQGSVQTQGEVLEVDFENNLRQAFPQDRIGEVPTGVRGADLSQEVVLNGTGKPCGTILHETKRTKAWNDAWVAKLKGDLRAARAEVGVIVTEALPKDIGRCGFKDGIWVTEPAFAIPLVQALRAGLQEVALAKGAREGAREKAEVLYDYFTGTDFRHRVEVVIQAFGAMRDDLEKERRALTKYWGKREKHINAVVENMAGMVGDVQGISGNALPEIEALELEVGD